ncbi:hypothetical protein CBR_g31207 [Chara braunii]|uniref:Uncharacterized protein n=1 Tax=Chara braunii TaxID=69332 RepID=A0A388JXP3_CHABU|nr:hypothetical protein CBR_g31207 [Chara braunii]|eukprot:GBG62570.1 hypothetical protein CBR_g31207 [Chara braunii]
MVVGADGQASAQHNAAVETHGRRAGAGSSRSDVSMHIDEADDLDVSYDHYLYNDDRRMHEYVYDCGQYEYTMAREMHDMEQRRHQSNVVVQYGVVGKVPNDHALREVFGRFVTDNQGLCWTHDELLDMLKKKEVQLDAVKSALANIEVNAKSVIEKFLQEERNDEVRDSSVPDTVHVKEEPKINMDMEMRIRSRMRSKIRYDLIDEIVKYSTQVHPHLLEECDALRRRLEKAECAVRKLLFCRGLTWKDPSSRNAVFDFRSTESLEALPKSDLIAMLHSLRTVGSKLTHRNAMLEVQNAMQFLVSDNQMSATVVNLGQLYTEAREEFMDAVFMDKFGDRWDYHSRFYWA